MAGDQKRTLSIVARLDDLASRQLERLGKTFESSTGRIARAVGAPFRALGGLIDRVANLRNAIGAFVAVRAFQGAKNIFSELEKLGEARAKIGGTAESVTALNYALRLSGSSLEEARPAFEAFARNVEAARNGAISKREALEELGFSIEQLRDGELDYVDILAKVAERYGAVESATKRNTVLNELFGKSASQLAPLLKDGADGLRALAEEARRRGVVFSAEELDQADRFGDAMDRLTIGWQTFVQRGLLTAEPVLTRVLGLATSVIDHLGAAGTGLFKAIGQDLAGIAVNPLSQELALIKQQLEAIDGIQAKGGFAQLRQKIRDGNQLKFGQAGDPGKHRLSFFGVPGSGPTVNELESLLPRVDELRARAQELGRAIQQGIGEGLTKSQAAQLPVFRNILEAAGIRTDDDVVRAVGAGLIPPEALLQGVQEGLFSANVLERIQELVNAQVGKGVQEATAAAVAAVPEDPAARTRARDRLGFRNRLLGLQDPSTAVDLERLSIGAEEQKLAFQESFDQGRISAEDLAIAIDAVDAATQRATARARGDFAMGFEDAAERGLAGFTNMTNVGQEAADRLVTGGLDRLTDGLAGVIAGTKSGKEAFKEFAQAMLSELSRVIARLLIVKALSGLGKLIGGDLGDALQGVTTKAEGGVIRGRMLAARKFADGGVTNGPTLGLFGEAGAEAFVPLRSGKIPVSITNRGAGDGLHVHYEISAVDGPSVRRLLTDERHHLAALTQSAIATRKGLRTTVKRANR